MEYLWFGGNAKTVTSAWLPYIGNVNFDRFDQQEKHSLKNNYVCPLSKFYS